MPQIITPPQFIVYTAEELKTLFPNGYAKALQYHAETACQDGWWFDQVYEDAAEIGLKITSFDLYRQEIDGELCGSLGSTIRAILKNHGRACSTYPIAMEYYSARHANASESVRKSFKRALLRCYLDTLQSESEYMESEDCFLDQCDSAEYKFKQNGSRYAGA